MADAAPDIRDRLVDAALPHVAFDGWSENTLRAAARDADIPIETARAALPRGAVDTALRSRFSIMAFHAKGDAAMVAALAAEDLSGMRFRDRVALAVRRRIEAIPDKDAVRRGAALFSLPMHAADGAKAIWATTDAIWTALGDTSDDINWYTKRATLSGVYSATVLYWLGDDSQGAADTWDFLDRRIDDVMRIEKVKAQVRKLPFVDRIEKAQSMILSRFRPMRGVPEDFPGRWSAGG